MNAVRMACLLLLILGVALWVGAEESGPPAGFSGELGTEATFLPDLGVDAWVDLDWTFGDLSFGTLTTVDVLPDFALREALLARYNLDPLWFVGQFDLDIVPLEVVDLRLSAGAGLLDIEGDDVSFRLDVELILRALPAFELTFGVDLGATVWAIDLWASADLDILEIEVDARLGGQARVLDLSWEGGRLSAFLRSSMIVLPDFDASVGFDVVFEAGVFGIRSETDIELTPFGLIEQRLELSFTFNGLEVYAWGGFLGDLSFLAGIGVTYALPTGSP